MSLKILSKDFSFYGIIDILQRSIGFILIPYYTRRLTPSEFGEYDIFIVISAFLFVLIDLQIIAGFNRFYHEFKSTIEKQKLIGSVILLTNFGFNFSSCILFGWLFRISRKCLFPIIL